MAACLARAPLTHPTGIALPQTCKHATDDGNRCSFRPRDELMHLGSSFVFQRLHTGSWYFTRLQTTHLVCVPDINQHDDPRTWAPPINPKRVPRLLLYWSPLEWFRALVPPSWVKAGVPPSQKSGDVAVLESHSNSFSSRVGMNIELGTLSSCHSFLGSFSFKLVRRCSFLGTTASSGLRHG